jgi:hypothetical protein
MIIVVMMENIILKEQMIPRIELCLKYHMDDLLAHMIHLIERMELTNIKLIQMIVDIEPLNILFPVVLKKLPNLPVETSESSGRNFRIFR